MAMKRRLGGSAVVLPTALLMVGGAAAQAQTSAQTPTTRGTAANLRFLSPLSGEVIAAGEFKLDISFESRTASPVVAAELWMDGEQWARRELETPTLKNLLTFVVDGSTLKPGPHQVSVKVVTRDGASSVSDLQLMVADKTPILPINPGNPVRTSPLAPPELTFRALPTRKLTGAVEITVDIKEGAGNPYVSFYVDRQFKTLKNYPPYSFVFDTTSVANGVHVIEALAYQETTNQTVTKRMEVTVDNAGGNTVRADRTETAAKPSTAVLPAPVSSIRTPSANAARIASASALSGSAVRGAGLRDESAPAVVRHSAARPAAPAALKGTGAPTLTERDSLPLMGAPRPTTTASGMRPNTVVPTVAARSTRNGISAAAPVGRGVPMAHKTNHSAAPVRAGIKPVVNTVLQIPDIRNGLQVAFDGSVIAFDVQPRVERGLPLAPFRQIFEHTGGQVMWIPESHTVRAVSANREIVFSVGGKQAKVNGEMVPFERNSYIEHGRTIVPLSFVGNALDVDVKYDAATGRLQITTRK